MNEDDAADQYFESYEELEVHQLMLADKPRTNAYRDAIFDWREKFKDRIVMDVGAGTGVLSIFCAQAGAAKVYAIEASQLAEIAKEVVAENDMTSTIEVIQSRVEDLEADAIGKVDIIVSEWMGFYLVHEGMLDSVLVARDRFLKADGLMFPSVAKLYAAPCQLPTFYQFWDDVYGVSMKCVGRRHRKTKSLKPEITTVYQQDLLTEAKMLAWLDLSDATTEELDHLGCEETVLVCNRDGRYQGVCIWFAVEFPNGTELSTGPGDELTHWKQTAVVMPTDIEVEKEEPIAFKLQLHRDVAHPRRYNMELSVLDAAELEHDIPCDCSMTRCIVARTYLRELPDNSNNEAR